MTFSHSRLAYADIIEILDRALEAEAGLRLDFEDERRASHFISRAVYFRGLDRRDNAKLHSADHELHGRSVYDKLQLSQIPPRQRGKPGGKLVVIAFHRLSAVTITELTEAELVELSLQYGQTAENSSTDGIDNPPKT